MGTSRTIMVANSATQKRYKVTTNAKTLGELKKCLTDNGISYENMSFTEGITKTTLSGDNTVLPTNVPFKGGVTNNLVLLLTNSAKHIKSGMTRREAYQAVKEGNLGDAIKEKFGRNFTQVSTADLEKFISSHCSEPTEEKEETMENITIPAVEEEKKEEEKYVQIPVELFDKLMDLLEEIRNYNSIEVTDDDLDDILNGF